MTHNVTLIPGDGTGPELADATRRVLEATGVEFNWDVQDAGADIAPAHGGNPLPDSVLDSIRRTRVAIKGPITTPVGHRLPLGQRRPAQGARPVRLRAALQELRGRAVALRRRSTS